MTRVRIDPQVAAQVLFAADHTCCVCNVRGRPLQVHHIDEDHANSERSNLAPLCLECHHQTQVRGGFARTLDAAAVLLYRDDWERRVARRRDEADRLHAQVRAAAAPVHHSLNCERGDYDLTGSDASVSPAAGASEGTASAFGVGEAVRLPLREYVATLPQLRRRVYSETRELWGGSGADVAEATYRVIAVLEDALVGLAGYYADWSFRDQSAKELIAEQVASRFRWRRFHHETPDIRAGTIVNNLVGGSVLGDVEQMVVDMVGSLLLDWEGDGFEAWKVKWASSSEP